MKLENNEELTLRSKKFSDSMYEIDQWDKIEENSENEQD